MGASNEHQAGDERTAANASHMRCSTRQSHAAASSGGATQASSQASVDHLARAQGQLQRRDPEAYQQELAFRDRRPSYNGLEWGRGRTNSFNGANLPETMRSQNGQSAQDCFRDRSLSCTSAASSPSLSGPPEPSIYETYKCAAAALQTEPTLRWAHLCCCSCARTVPLRV